MGSQQSTTVSIIAKGEDSNSPFSTRLHPKCPEGPAVNPPEFQTMQDVMKHIYKKWGPRPYLGARPFKEGRYGPQFIFKSYTECEVIANEFGAGLAQIGIKYESLLGVYAPNCYCWLHAIDASCLYGFAIVSLYDSLGPDSLSYLIKHSQMTAIMSSTKNAPKVFDLLDRDKSQVKTVILIDNEKEDEFVQRGKGLEIEVITFDDVCELGRKYPIELPKIDPESTHFICYSSGTTGNPKGVIISQRACVSNTFAAADMIHVGEKGRYLSYLPLAHVFERAAVAITALGGGAIHFISGDVSKLVEDMGIVKPTYFAAVPRVMNRFYEGVNDKLKKSGPAKRTAFWACFYAKKFCLRSGLPVGLFDVIAFNQIKNMMGGCVVQFVVGGAAMDPYIDEFLQVATGTAIRNGYGLTEAGSGNICSPPDVKFCIPGTVGGPLINVKARLEPIEDYDDPRCGELMLGGQCLSSGYLHDEEATHGLFTDETREWIHTGDVGKWESNGYLRIVDRMRSIFKLSQGEYVAAEYVTQVYEEAPLVNQIFVYGDSSRTCLVAVVVPKIGEVAKWANVEHLDQKQLADMCENNKALKDAVQEQLNTCAKNKHIFGYQYVRAVALDPVEWSIDNDLLTPTFKLKRKKLEVKYASTIEKLYEGLNKK